MNHLCKPFWQTKTLNEMTGAEWEALCDHCGRCCLQKLENKKTGRIYYTRVACYLLDSHQCCCSDYPERSRRVKGCLQLTPQRVARWRWLPKTCAYRRIAEGKGLETWHPLVSGSFDTVHAAGISVRGQTVSEAHIHPDDIEAYVWKLNP